MMMRFLYFAIKFLPFWAIPLSLIFAELGVLVKRRMRPDLMKIFYFISGFFVFLTILFFVFKWDVTAYPWIRERTEEWREAEKDPMSGVAIPGN